MVSPPVLFASCSPEFFANRVSSAPSAPKICKEHVLAATAGTCVRFHCCRDTPKRRRTRRFARRSLMQSCLRVAIFTGCMLLSYPAQASHFHRGPTSRSHKTKHASGALHSHASAAHPRAIDDARASEIQTALVKAGYLQTASGKWDGASADAMRKLQGDNGWQTKLIPDSRALIKLGLGPGAETATPGGSGGGLSEVSSGAPESGAATPSRR